MPATPFFVVTARKEGFGESGHHVQILRSGKHVKWGRVSAAIKHADLDQDVGWCLLGVFQDDIEIAIFVECAGIKQLVLCLGASAPPVRLNKIVIRKFT